MKYFIKELPVPSIGINAGYWVEDEVIFKPRQGVALVKYVGFVSKAIFETEGSQPIPGAIKQYRISNWVEKSKVEGEPDIAHNDFDVLVSNGLDAALDDALVNYVQNRATDTDLADAIVE